MKEKLYTIPVNEAFHTDCECPICKMYKSIEVDAIDYTMDNSYMQDDVRMETNKTGFCKVHLKQMYDYNNRLGLALILKTHMDETIQQVEQLAEKSTPSKPKLFQKKESTPLETYLDTLHTSCFVCNRIDQTFERYIATILYLYRTDADFRALYTSSKGFCTEHYRLLLLEAKKQLNSEQLNDFYTITNKLYLDHMKRVRDDLEWFADKFDYRYVDAPWKNSKDALPRSMTKIKSIIDEIDVDEDKYELR